MKPMPRKLSAVVAGVALLLLAAVPLLAPRLEPELRERMLTGLEQEGTALATRARQLLLAELGDQEAAS